MSPRKPGTFRLTSDVIAAHAGASGIVALYAGAEGRSFTLHAKRPGATTNRSGRAFLAATRADFDPMGVKRAEPEPPQNDVLLVTVEGPLEERAGWHDPCGGWTDGHDAVYERLAAAFEIGDVVLHARSPGGVCAGGREWQRRAAEMKAKHGRRCIGHVALGASMMYWWLAAICDEIYVDVDGVAGSIGVRGMHASIAGMLARDGIAPTFSAWPNDGKLAGVPELPLSDVAKARMDRDVATIGEAFAATVAACPTATRAGLDRDGVVALSADALTGQAAVNAGLADGVATLEDVIGFALATAGGGATMYPDKEEPKGGDNMPADDDNEGTACAHCGLALDPKDAYCSKCGTATVPPKDDDAPPPSEDKEKEGRAAAAAKPSAAIVPPAQRTGAGPLDILGIDAKASLPAQKAHAAAIRQVLDFSAQLTGQTEPSAIVGGLAVVGKDAAESVTLRAQIAADRKRAETTERDALAKRLVACDVDGWTRGDVFVDAIGAGGKRVVSLAPVVAEMKLGTLRGMVEGFEKRKTTRDPFQPDPEAAKAAEQAANPAAPLPANGEPTEAQIVAAMATDAVKAMAAQTGKPAREIAATYLKNKSATAAPQRRKVS